MNQATENRGIVFADISGSTRLFEQLGDTQARSVVSHCLDLMSQVTRQFGGTIIKTIGDEIMSSFPDPDSTIYACVSMQENVSADMSAGFPLMIRVGAHFGPVIVQEDGDVYGDSVNLAKRLSDIARANQIITSEDTVNGLSPVIQQDAREFDRAGVKGKEGVLRIFEIVWKKDDADGTVVAGATMSGPAPEAVNSKLALKWNGQTHVIDLQEHQGIQIGRGAQADYTMGGRLTSRVHLRIEMRRGKFVISDQSRNGTYVRPDVGRPFFLRREEAPLSGAGVIGLGTAPEEAAPEDIIRFESV